ncbi:hypothetical protein AGDE_10251 [Angomonas deanei]|uniref:Uncharacterized protein n=1 Tax=Angomonas deanei TaxID=59799 RepID=A0A7G2C037_9TRYP|nr:hypothetical protein AGDE_10251 [Angomonas deanei]CAD2212684.1 hypothetical protein, conserved [Angomonas deanei]|eukprot:EPY28850.1 hypothetical protein AGDE_10251 [Angomonas deanei]
MLRRNSVSLAKKGDFSKKLKGFASWYPNEGGVFLGNLLAGHNLFIADTPKRFDKKHARHFSLVETLTITPLFTLSMVHYFSVFCQHPERAALMPLVCLELGRKTVMQKEWIGILKKDSPVDGLLWSVGLLSSQIVLFPLWLIVSSAAPQLVHATLNQTNHILYTKYECISEASPPFVSTNVPCCREQRDFHEKQMYLPTDFMGAIIFYWSFYT